MTSQQENKLILCGCGWLGGYLASHFRSQMTIYGTTRSEDKARALSQQGIQAIPYTLVNWSLNSTAGNPSRFAICG